MTEGRRLKLGLSMAGHGYHDCAWLHDAAVLHGPSSFDYYRDLARTAERGLFDMVFLADLSYFSMVDVPSGALGRRADGGLEPLTLLAALATHTSNIGLAATASTTFFEPYHLARFFASIDQLSGGRGGWNLVTSSQDEEAQNFGSASIVGKHERYCRAEEFVDVVTGLWDSFDDDTFVADRCSGLYFHPSKVRQLNHKGRFFSVAGPLNVRRSPQGRPVVIQAGASENGRELAARTADIVYTLQPTLEGAKRFYADMKARLPRHGRQHGELLVMPGLLPVVGATAAEAQAKVDRLKELIDPVVGLEYLSGYFGDLSRYPLDGPLPELRDDKELQSRSKVLLEIAKSNGYTIRQLIQHVSISNAHYVAVGTPAQVADTLEEWFRCGAADGFNILPAISPISLVEFVEHVVPELQRRGLYRLRYESSTLRGNLFS